MQNSNAGNIDTFTRQITSLGFKMSETDISPHGILDRSDFNTFVFLV
jgi:hypothetical protein